MNPRHWQVTLTTSMSALLFVIFSSVAFAYPDYDGCKDCHGGFEEDNYVSKSGWFKLESKSHGWT